MDASDPWNFTLRPGGTLGTYLVDGETNPCTSLTVQAGAGVFIGGNRILHDGFPLDGRQELELRPIHSQFEIAGGAAANWVLPLANFMPKSSHGFVHPELANHPLRLLPMPTVVSDLAAQD